MLLLNVFMLDNLYSTINTDGSIMAKSKKKIVVKMQGKRGPGRPRKDVIINEKDMVEDVGLPGLFQPGESDLLDELSRMDSFSNRNYY